MSSFKTMIDELSLTHRLIGTLAAIYDIPLAEIDEIRERLKEEDRLKKLEKANARKAAKKKINKLMPKFKVVNGG